MEQFRQIGEVIGSLKALMVFQDEIRINQKQCCLLVDAFDLAFDVIKEEIHKNLCFSERLTKWKALDHPLKELQRIFREGEQYIRQCFETKDWWGKAVLINQSTECVDFHLHNLLWCIPVVLEAVECAAEISGSRQEDIQKKRIMFSKKYERDWMEPMIFQLKYGKQYLVSPEMCRRMETAWREDRWILSEMISDKKDSGISKQENRLGELLLAPRGKFFPTSLLLNSKDYQFRRRLGTGGKYKEIQWMGESFVAKHLIGEIDPIAQQVSIQSSVTHPNVMHIMYAFADEEKKESFLLMELMHRDLSGYIREVSSSKRRIPFPLLVAVDVMLQIARGMEHLHSRKIYHGELNPSNVLVRTRSSSHDIGGYLQAKITGFGVSAMTQTHSDTCIWYAPEVLEEQERSAADSSALKYSEKADVYSFGMICFELLTGKVPFEDSHLQGDKMSRNIKAGERPLFPFPSSKCVTNLVKKCWQAEPSQRPDFPSICRVLRYIKRFLIMNPDHNSQPESPTPNVDYFDLEMSLSKKYASWARKEEPLRVSEIPFQMFAYRVLEREKNSMNIIIKDKSSESGSEDASLCGDENAPNLLCTLDDSLSGSVTSSKSSLGSSDTSKSSQVGTDKTKIISSTKKANGKDRKETWQKNRK